MNARPRNCSRSAGVYLVDSINKRNHVYREKTFIKMHLAANILMQPALPRTAIAPKYQFLSLMQAVHLVLREHMGACWCMKRVRPYCTDQNRMLRNVFETMVEVTTVFDTVASDNARGKMRFKYGLKTTSSDNIHCPINACALNKRKKLLLMALRYP
jgi:hypothetical protein